MKNKTVAALLAFIGGYFGLHKFYLRDPGAGIFYIFLSFMTAKFFPVSILLGMVDGLRYLMMPSDEFDRKFNRRYQGRRRQRKNRTNRTNRRTPQSSSIPKNRKGSKRARVRSNPFKKSGLDKYREFDIEDAIEDFQKALKIDPQDVSLYFNLACAYSLLEDKEKAFEHLELAISNGLSDPQRIMTHDDLAFIRIQPEFEEFKASGFRLKKSSSTKSGKSVGEKPMDDILLAQLNRLMELRKKGVLTEQEFLRERKKVLAR